LPQGRRHASQLVGNHDDFTLAVADRVGEIGGGAIGAGVPGKSCASGVTAKVSSARGKA
jgi:hypothetical protein